MGANGSTGSRPPDYEARVFRIPQADCGVRRICTTCHSERSRGIPSHSRRVLSAILRLAPTALRTDVLQRRRESNENCRCPDFVLARRSGGKSFQSSGFFSRAKEVGAELIVFPEMTDTGYSMPVIQKHADHWKTGFVASLQEIASQLSIAIVSGVSERDESSIYNSQVLVDTKGDIVAKYRKTHLYAVAPVEEQTCFRSRQ